MLRHDLAFRGTGNEVCLADGSLRDRVTQELLAYTPVPIATPWADPGHDVMADIIDVMARARQAGLAPRRKLHCAADVAEALVSELMEYAAPRDPSALGAMAWMTGMDIMTEHSWESGRWEIRWPDGEVVMRGRLGDLDG